MKGIGYDGSFADHAGINEGSADRLFVCENVFVAIVEFHEYLSAKSLHYKLPLL